MRRLLKFSLLTATLLLLVGGRCGSECECSCLPPNVSTYALDRGRYLEATWCSPESGDFVTDTFREVVPEITVGNESCSITLLYRPIVKDTLVCASDTCANVIGLDIFYPIHLYSDGDTLPGDGFYLKVARMDTSIYLIGLEYGSGRVHISPDLYDNLAPDTGGYSDTVRALVPTDPSYGHALWLDRGDRDINFVAPGDIFGKITVLGVSGDSVRIRVLYRSTPFNVPGLRWIKGG